MVIDNESVKINEDINKYIKKEFVSNGIFNFNCIALNIQIQIP
jgi:hypothetical protein